MDVLIEASDTNRTDVTAVHINEDSALVFRPTSDENAQPGPSELSLSRANDPSQVATLPFEQRILTLSKKEQKTARAFLNNRIEDQYEWPLSNSSKDEELMRKYRIQAKLHAVRQQRYQNPENEEVLQQRRQVMAEKQQRYRNPEDEQLLQDRRQQMQTCIVDFGTQIMKNSFKNVEILMQ